MNKLEQQQTFFENIKTLCDNYKKDGASRKNREYLNKRLTTLDALWGDFENQHSTLLLEIEDKNIQYFTDNVYTKTKAMYNSTKSDILNLMHNLPDTNTTFDFTGYVEDGMGDNIQHLLCKQECNFKAIDRVMSKINISITNEKWELEDNLSILKSKWEAIDKLHWELESLLKGSNDSYINTFIAIESKYDQMRKELNSRIWSTVHYQQSAPRIEIPEFAGNYNQWISFKDLFIEAVHNNPMINTAQKMQHLKTKLRGEAERLVQHLTISADNYKSCWDILNQRYDNRRLQCISFMNTMLNLAIIQQPDAFNIKKMHDVITECLSGLNNIGIDTATWDPIIVHVMSQKLDSASYNEYIKEIHDHREVPVLNEFLFFLESKFMAYETMRRSKKEVVAQQKSSFVKTFNKEHPIKKNHFAYNYNKTYSKSYHTTYGQCPFCDGNHVLMQCQKFIDLDVPQRNTTVTKLQICKNCLFSHGDKECRSSKTCKECNMKHHSLLHNIAKKPTLPTNYGKNLTGHGQRPSTSTSTQQASNHHLANKGMEVLLPTAQIKIQSVDGTFVTLRALLDQGSQVNLISENAAQLLRLPRKKLNATISGIGELSGDCKGKIQLTCKSSNSDYTFEVEALIMKKLTNNLPHSTFDKINWPHLENLKLADNDFNESKPIDLLLGADVYADILMDGVLRGEQRSPIAQQTRLGWILCGKLVTFNCHVTLTNMNDLTKFWENEDIAQNAEDISQDDQCEQFYRNTVQRAADGKYIVKMPLCTDIEDNLGKSKHIAVSQFLHLEKRLERQKNLAEMYKAFLKEYAELLHMKPSTSTLGLESYLTHHCVVRESTTTQLRVVFNASQKTTSGHSLNSLQQKGPNLQKDIQALILKWRSYKYAFTADVEKMYRCIWISEDQQQLQKIIWRDSPSDKLQEYQLCTVTYGTKSAPWLAMRTLKQLAIDDGHKYPEAATILLNEFYVDDLISGHNSIDEANKLQESLINLLRGGGMNLRKWTANNQALLENLTENQISTKKLFDFKNEDSMKTLGLSWNPKADTFIFNWNFDSKSRTPLTKRILLSEISQLYDPLGWMSPVTVTAKLIFQKVWISKLTWDDALPSNIQEDWLKLKAELPQVKDKKLNRWIGGTENDVELLGFCDASEKALSCVIYTRVINEHGTPTITLLAAKTRVAPLAKRTTLPRLELCGALLLSQLMEKARQAFKDKNITIQAWSDSQVVIAWLQGDTSRWEKYVANRVTRIKRVIPAEKWQYIKSEQNPADCASRGMYPSKLVHFDLWWQGPAFLQTYEKQEMATKATCLFTTEVEAANKKQTTLTTTQNTNFINELLEKCSSLTRVIRVTAWILRFSANARDNMKCDTNYLTTKELAAAVQHVIRCAQQIAFAQEIKLLSHKNTVSKQSSIYKLYPFLDENGIIRSKGRLSNSNLPTQMKNPIILPRQGRLTHLVIHQAHLSTLHGTVRQAIVYIRQRYLIIGGNRAVKSQLRNCVRCYRYKPSDNYQKMGDLPQQRTIPSRPFTHTGVDFTGHVDVKLNKGRGVKTSKGYIAIFVCMATKAVHIELASDLSTETFIAAFQRMCSRRGTPKHMYSDCGTNFVGASKVLRNEFDEFKQNLSPSFFDEISKLEVEWHLNVPAWPSGGGGIWEAAVKSMKHHLRRVLGDQKLTYEEFTTLLAKIEACMNSRPLCPLTEDPDEFYNYLTPGHFLTGSPTTSLPLSDYSDAKVIDMRRRWQLTEHMMQQFWRYWSNDYLIQLQTRSKWHKASENLKVGNIVLVKEDNLPPGKWAMGRVQEVHPGADGYVRVATIKTQNNIIKRPIVKLAPLPIETDEQPQNYQPTNSNQKKPARYAQANKIGNNCFLTLFTIMITMSAVFTGSNAAVAATATQITTFEPNRPIYYDTIGKIQVIHDEWTLLMYYNLTNYWEGVSRIETYLYRINELCQKTDPRYCKTTQQQLYHEMALLKYYNTILLAPHKHLSDRRKRGIVDGVGYLANSLFGILDQRFANKYQQDITAVQNNENYLLELIKNQTSIVELENNVLKRHEDNMKRQFDIIETFMKQTNENFANIETEIESVMATSYFNSAAFSAYLLINNLKNVQEMLLNTLTDVYKGHIDVHLVTPVNLMKQLNEISGRLPKTFSLPIENVREDIKDLYKLLYVKARVTDSFFLFEVHIPLISDEDFMLHRAIPLPITTITGTFTIQTSFTYIAVNFRKNIFISLASHDLKQCVQIKPENFICNKNLPVFKLDNSKVPCEAKLLAHHTSSPCDVTNASCSDSWIELHAPNAWLAVCCETCALRTICGSDVTSYTMTSSGIVTLAQGCVLQSKYMTIHSHNQYNSKIKMDYNFVVPTLNSSINNIVNITHLDILHLHSSETSETEIEKQLITQKEHERNLPSQLTIHDVHQFAIIYFLLAVALVTVILWGVRRRYPHMFCKHKETNQCSLQSVKPNHEEIELQPIPRKRNPRQENKFGSSTTDTQRTRRHFAHDDDDIAFNFN